MLALREQVSENVNHMELAQDYVVLHVFSTSGVELLDSITREEVYYMQKAEFTCHSLWKICLY
jgi:hypothetical protein